MQKALAFKIPGISLLHDEQYMMAPSGAIISRKPGRKDILITRSPDRYEILCGRRIDVHKIRRELFGKRTAASDPVQRICPDCGTYKEKRSTCDKCYKRRQRLYDRDKLRLAAEPRYCDNPACGEELPTNARVDKCTCSTRCRVAVSRLSKGRG